MTIQDGLRVLVQGGRLTAAEARGVFSQVMEEGADPGQVGALLALMATREPSVEELVGLAEVMREKMVRIEAPADVIDTCGTGGAGSRIFNVSTTAAIVAAACGVPVVKHGNRSVTSRSGSSDVLRVLGVNVEAAADVQAKCLKEAGICFAFAPRHHPAMKHVGPIRQALGFATIFNLVAPMINPAAARRQLVGTRSRGLADKLLAVLVAGGAKRAMVVHGGDGTGGGGLCEISVSGPTYVASFDAGGQRSYELRAQDVGLAFHPVSALEIGSVEESAARVRAVLKGDKGGSRDIVLINAGAALWVAGRVEDIKAGTEMAAQAIDSGNARETLESLARITQAG